jgi:hypothetical protein
LWNINLSEGETKMAAATTATTTTSGEQRVKLLERMWLAGAQCEEVLSIEVS